MNSTILDKEEIDKIYEDAKKGRHSVVTADAIITSIEGTYYPSEHHRESGKRIRVILESMDWTYEGEVSKIVNGNPTTVGLYTKHST